MIGVMKKHRTAHAKKKAAPTSHARSMVEAENFGASSPAQGRLTVVRTEHDLRRVRKGDIVQFRREGDLVAYVTQAFDTGACGFIASCGRTNHGVIAAKELSVPFYVIRDHILKAGAFYTLSRGVITEGREALPAAPKPQYPQPSKTKTEVRINLGFPSRRIEQEPALATYSDGVGFARLEFAILGIIGNQHPITYLLKHGHERFVSKLYAELQPAVKAFSGKSFWIRMDDFSPQQLKELKGGEKYEITTGNELVSFRGIARSIDPKWLDLGNFEHRLKGVRWVELQLRALAMLSKDFPKTQIGVFVPMVHDVSEYRAWKSLAEPILGNVDYGLMVEVPSVAGEGIRPFLDEHLISFMIIGSNDLTALTLGLDRNDMRLQHLFNEEHPSVLRAMEETIRNCKAHGVKTAIGGAAASRPSLIKRLFKTGIDVFSVNPDMETVTSVRDVLAQLEK